MQHRIETSALSVSCHIDGPDWGLPMILLHGWPDDWRTWNKLLPLLHEAGYRTIVPSLRGFGQTRFKSEHAFRSGEMTAIAEDTIELADALDLDRLALVGHDWGARAAYIVASQHGQRLTHLIALSVGYAALDPNQEIGINQIERYWYQWYMALPQGERLVRERRAELARHAWHTWSPSWRFPELEFELTAQSFNNPDWAEITVHSYRQRWGMAEGDPDYAGIEAYMNPAPRIAVPTLVIHGADDHATLPESSEGKQDLFSGRYQRIGLKGVGHFPQREAPEEVARTILDFIAGHDRDVRPLKAAS
jgi:pimeloyl-ACP methyl ester carboxylesterase